MVGIPRPRPRRPIACPQDGLEHLSRSDICAGAAIAQTPAHGRTAGGRQQVSWECLTPLIAVDPEISARSVSSERGGVLLSFDWWLPDSAIQTGHRGRVESPWCAAAP